MNKITINKRSVLRVLLGVYLFPLYLVVFSLSVPPNDLPICGLMFALAGVGYMLARRESRAWRLIWVIALAISVLCGVLEVVAGQRIARRRSHHESNLANPRSALDARTALCFHIESHWPGASESERWAG
jgi:4-amino-4-deoxy-L-arabinose transferase-like glycosyltransferase